MNKPTATEFAAGAKPADAPAPAAAPVVEPDRPGLLARLRAPLMIGGVVLVALFAAIAYFTGGRYESTDDAYIRVAGVDVSSNLSGRVVEVDVKENQRVGVGQVLFRLDPAPYDIAIEAAQAQVADARQQLQADLATYQQRQVDVKNAQDAAAYAERERRREQGLLAAGAVSAAEADQANRQASGAQLQVAMARQALASSLANLGGRADLSPDTHPKIRDALSQLARARLQRSWTVIHASQDGRVTKVEQLQVGDYINAATPVFHLVTGRTWVDANFKENQLKHMHPGESASVKVDAYPGRTFDAVVESLAPGTDQTFSLMPAENASGNWVKVVQRLPVRLVFRHALPIELQGGLSARVKVDTGYKRGLFGSHEMTK